MPLLSRVKRSTGPFSTRPAHRLVRRVAHLGELCLQRAVTRLRRVELRQRLAEVVGGRDLLQHIVGVERELVVDVRADAAEVHAPGHGMARIGQQRLGELQLGLCLLLGAADVELRHPVVFRIEPVGVDGAEIFDRVLGALARRALGDPERLEVAGLLIERDDRVAVGLARDHAVELLAGDDLANLLPTSASVAALAAGASIATGLAVRSRTRAGAATGRPLARERGPVRHGRARVREQVPAIGRDTGAGPVRIRRQAPAGRRRLGLRLGAGRLGVVTGLAAATGFTFAPQFNAGWTQGVAGWRQRCGVAEAGSVPRKRMPSSIVSMAWACCPACCSRADRMRRCIWLEFGGAAESGGRYRQDQRQRGAGEKPNRVPSWTLCIVRVLHFTGPRS